jgi:hypothetical protein
VRTLDPVELDILEDAHIILTEEELAFDDEGEADMTPVEQAAADRLKARGLVVEDHHEHLHPTARGRLALNLYRALRVTPV